LDYKKEAERWQKNYEAMPFKKGLYAPLFKRSEHESDEEYVKNCEEAYTLLCCMGLYSSSDEAIRENIKEYMDKTYSDWTDNQLLELMKRDLENDKTKNENIEVIEDIEGFQIIPIPKNPFRS